MNKDSRLVLMCGPDFPDKNSVVIDAGYLSSSGGFRIGRSQTCELRIRDPLISRIHVSFYWDSRTERIMIINGGVYPDGYSSCKNAPYLNGIKLEECDPQPVQEGDRLFLLKSYRFLVYASPEITCITELWDDDVWSIPGLVVPKVNGSCEIDLKPIESVEINTSLIVWAMTPPKNLWDAFLKVLVVLAIILVGIVLI